MKCKFEPLERDSNHSNANANFSKGIRRIQMQIRTIRKGFEALKFKFEAFERDSKHSKVIGNSNANSNHSKGIRSILMKFEPFERDSKHSNGNANHSFEEIQILTILKKFEAFEANSNHSKGIGSIRIQIRTIRNGFVALKC